MLPKTLFLNINSIETRYSKTCIQYTLKRYVFKTSEMVTSVMALVLTKMSITDVIKILIN